MQGFQAQVQKPAFQNDVSTSDLILDRNDNLQNVSKGFYVIVHFGDSTVKSRIYKRGYECEIFSCPPPFVFSSYCKPHADEACVSLDVLFVVVDVVFDRTKRTGLSRLFSNTTSQLIVCWVYASVSRVHCYCVVHVIVTHKFCRLFPSSLYFEGNSRKHQLCLP